MDNLSPEVLFAIGLAAAVIVFVLKKVFVDRGQNVPNWVYTIGVYVVSFVLALLFAPIVLPPFDPGADASEFVQNALAYLVALLPAISAFVGFATLIYNSLKTMVLEKLASGLKKLVRGADTA